MIMLEINVRAYASNTYTLGQGYFKNLFCQWLAVEHPSETVFIHPVSSHPALPCC